LYRDVKHAKNNPNNKRLQVPEVQRQNSYYREDWQLDFTHMPGGPKSKLLLVFVDTFSGWVEAFPCSTEHAREVVFILITEIIPHFGLPKSFQSDNGPPFKAEITQGLSRTLGIEYHLHCPRHYQSSGKVLKTSELLYRHLAKLAPETHSLGPSSSLLLSSGSETPQSSRDWIPFESLWQALPNQYLLDQETAQLISHITQLAKFQQTLSEIKQATPRKDT
jgi:transposase InsO family protein